MVERTLKAKARCTGLGSLVSMAKNRVNLIHICVVQCMAYSIDAGKSTNFLPMYAGKNLVGPDYIHLPWFLGHYGKDTGRIKLKVK